MGKTLRHQATAYPKHNHDRGNPAGGFSLKPRRFLLPLGIMGIALVAGCISGSSTPLYYTARSSVPGQPNAQYVMPAQAQAQPQMQVPSQVPMPPQMPPQPPGVMPAAAPSPGPYCPPNVALQQQLLQQTVQASQGGYRDYKVGAEDLLVVDVLGQEGLKRELRVNGQGQISMPLVGVIPVAGLSTRQIEDRLREAYGTEYLRNPQVNVEVKEFHHQRVAVTGAVIKPGYYDIIGPRSLLEVLSMAGGLGNKPGPEAGDVIYVIKKQDSSDSRTTAVRAFAPQTKTTVINLQRLVSGQAPDLNLMVENGDVVYVPFAGNAYVLGAVKKPTNVTVKDNLSLSQAIAMAGGIDPLYATYNIAIMRFDEQGRPIRVEANLKDITSGKEADIPIKDNDAIVVQEGELKTKLWVIRQLLPIPSGGYAIPTR